MKTTDREGNVRDARLMAQIRAPVLLSRVGAGITPQQAKEAENAHSRKIMGLTYNMLNAKSKTDQLANKRK